MGGTGQDMGRAGGGKEGKGVEGYSPQTSIPGAATGLKVTRPLYSLRR